MAIMEAERTIGEYGMTITDEKGHQMIIDIPVDQGGNGSGFRPMQTVLAAFSGCSSADVVSILKKQRQDLKGLKIHVDGHREAGKEPSLWEKVHAKFEISGEVDPLKGYRAAELSVMKYCSVAETLRRAGATISFEVYVNGKKVESSN
ncbi:MAG: osmotically inducible protein OsmC [Bacteroidetes bacterium]|nr:MAG: osmotically inducible protein OsmC [Bacteroidota bacterium]